jgi:thiamine monophosphate kinase
VEELAVNPYQQLIDGLTKCCGYFRVKLAAGDELTGRFLNDNFSTEIVSAHCEFRLFGTGQGQTVKVGARIGSVLTECGHDISTLDVEEFPDDLESKGSTPSSSILLFMSG